MDILGLFPGKPRPVQQEALREIERAWSSADVFVVNLPVGAGKSRIAVTLARWANKRHSLSSAIITPTNLLVDQYIKDFSRLFTLAKRETYACQTVPDTSCQAFRDKNGRQCKDCYYSRLMRQAHAVPYGVFNNHIYLAHSLYKNVLIADEAHNLVRVLKDRAALRYWTHDYHFPEWVQDYGSLLRWLEANPRLDEDTKLQKLYNEINSPKPRYTITRCEALFRGNQRDGISLSPVDVRDQPPLFWPNQKVRKIVLLSATIGKKDIEQLGLDKRRVIFINATSPVDKDRRPIISLSACNMSYKHQEAAIPEAASAIRQLLQEHSEKGIIHATYDVAARLRTMLHGELRLRWHTRENARSAYEEFKNSPVEEGQVLVASGMYEGVDLPYDAARWQVISKVPYPSLKEPAVKYLAEKDPEWYHWETAKLILQASGRVVRASDDWGVTYILDSSFEMLYNKAEHLFPQWWQDSLAFMSLK